MKKKMRMFIFVFLTVMVMGAMRPALLYSGAFPTNPWDFLIDTVSFTGTKWTGPLSVYYKFIPPPSPNPCIGGEPYANLYFTVNLIKGGVPYAYYGESSTPVCRDAIYQQRDELRSFLNEALTSFYGSSKDYSNGDWKLKSINNATYFFDDWGGVFGADIQITVK